MTRTGLFAGVAAAPPLATANAQLAPEIGPQRQRRQGQVAATPAVVSGRNRGRRGAAPASEGGKLRPSDTGDMQLARRLPPRS